MQGDSANLSRAVQNDVLMSIGAKAIAVRDAGVSRLLVVAEMPPQVDEHVDLAHTGALEAIRDALDTAVFGGDRMLRVFGKVGDSDKEFELIIPDRKLRKAMLVYSRNVAFLSLLISLITATLVFLTIDRIMIRPIRDMTRSMLAFSEAPDDPGRVIRPEDRADEIGVAERELADMQRRLQKTLGEQKHLADLGLAVSKINHDMRNILASAQLMSDRLRRVKDPSVQAFAPKLLRALDRAVAYSEGVLAYGRTAGGARRRAGGCGCASWSTRCRACSASTRPAASNSTTLSTRRSRSTPIPTSCSACSPISAATPSQAMAADAGAALVRRLAVSAERIGKRLPHPRDRHRPRPAAESARKPVRRLPRLGPQRRHRARPGHRP